MIIDFLSENRDVFLRVLKDVAGVTKYLHIGLSIALVYLTVYLLYTIFCKLFKREKKIGTDHAVAMFMMLIYMTALFYIVFMSRETGSYSGVNLELFSSWGRTVTTKAFFIENILLFIPMGILMPSAFPIFRKPYISIPVFFIMSCFIEGIQYFFELGIAELDDVLTNTAGGIIGLLIYGLLYIIHILIRHFRKKS